MIRSLCLAVVLAWVAGTPARVIASPSSAEDWRFPVLTPAVRTAWMGAQLLGEDTPTSPTMQRLFERRLAAAAATDDSATTHTTAGSLSDQEGLAMLLAEALADKRLGLAPEVRAHWRARAEAIVALPGRRWGAEALAMPALNADIQPGRAEYLEWLFAQFDSDKTPGNGYGASQAALAAMEQAPELMLPEVLAAWRAWDRADRAIDHRRLRLAQLAMARAVGSVTGDTEGITTIEAYNQLAPRDQATLRAIAVKSLTTVAGWENDALDRELLHSLVRPMAFHLLTTIQPRPWDDLLTVANHPEAFRSQRDWVWMRVVVEAPSLLLAEGRADLAPMMVVRSWRVTSLLEMLLTPPAPDNAVEVEGCGEEGYYYYGEEDTYFADAELPRAFFAANRDRLLARVAARLDNPPPGRWGERDDMRLLSFLTRTRYAPARFDVMNRLVANLASDSVWWNRGESIGLLMGASLSDDERLMVRSGLRVAAKEGDAEMVSACVTVLREVEPDYTLTEEPEVIAWMLEELEDDDEYGNGALAYAVLRDGLPDAASNELLRSIAADEKADPQQRHAARQLMAGSYWLGDYAQIEWELRQRALEEEQEAGNR